MIQATESTPAQEKKEKKSFFSKISDSSLGSKIKDAFGGGNDHINSLRESIDLFLGNRINDIRYFGEEKSPGKTIKAVWSERDQNREVKKTLNQIKAAEREEKRARFTGLRNTTDKLSFKIGRPLSYVGAVTKATLGVVANDIALNRSKLNPIWQFARGLGKVWTTEIKGISGRELAGRFEEKVIGDRTGAITEEKLSQAVRNGAEWAMKMKMLPYLIAQFPAIKALNISPSTIYSTYRSLNLIRNSPGSLKSFNEKLSKAETNEEKAKILATFGISFPLFLALEKNFPEIGSGPMGGINMALMADVGLLRFLAEVQEKVKEEKYQITEFGETLEVIETAINVAFAADAVHGLAESAGVTHVAETAVEKIQATIEKGRSGISDIQTEAQLLKLIEERPDLLSQKTAFETRISKAQESFSTKLSDLAREHGLDDFLPESGEIPPEKIVLELIGIDGEPQEYLITIPDTDPDTEIEVVKVTTNGEGVQAALQYDNDGGEWYEIARMGPPEPEGYSIEASEVTALDEPETHTRDTIGEQLWNSLRDYSYFSPDGELVAFRVNLVDGQTLEQKVDRLFGGVFDDAAIGTELSGQQVRDMHPDTMSEIIGEDAIYETQFYESLIQKILNDADQVGIMYSQERLIERFVLFLEASQHGSTVFEGEIKYNDLFSFMFADSLDNGVMITAGTELNDVANQWFYNRYLSSDGTSNFEFKVPYGEYSSQTLLEYGLTIIGSGDNSQIIASSQNEYMSKINGASLTDVRVYSHENGEKTEIDISELSDVSPNVTYEIEFARPQDAPVISFDTPIVPPNIVELSDGWASFDDPSEVATTATVSMPGISPSERILTASIEEKPVLSIYGNLYQASISGETALQVERDVLYNFLYPNNDGQINEKIPLSESSTAVIDSWDKDVHFFPDGSIEITLTDTSSSGEPHTIVTHLDGQQNVISQFDSEYMTAEGVAFFNRSTYDEKSLELNFSSTNYRHEIQDHTHDFHDVQFTIVDEYPGTEIDLDPELDGNQLPSEKDYIDRLSSFYGENYNYIITISPETNQPIVVYTKPIEANYDGGEYSTDISVLALNNFGEVSDNLVNLQNASKFLVSRISGNATDYSGYHISGMDAGQYSFDFFDWDDVGTDQYLYRTTGYQDVVGAGESPLEVEIQLDPLRFESLGLGSGDPERMIGSKELTNLIQNSREFAEFFAAQTGRNIEVGDTLDAVNALKDSFSYDSEDPSTEKQTLSRIELLSMLGVNHNLLIQDGILYFDQIFIPEGVILREDSLAQKYGISTSQLELKSTDIAGKFFVGIEYDQDAEYLREGSYVNIEATYETPAGKLLYVNKDGSFSTERPRDLDDVAEIIPLNEDSDNLTIVDNLVRINTSSNFSFTFQNMDDTIYAVSSPDFDSNRDIYTERGELLYDPDRQVFYVRSVNENGTLGDKYQLFGYSHDMGELAEMAGFVDSTGKADMHAYYQSRVLQQIENESKLGNVFYENDGTYVIDPDLEGAGSYSLFSVENDNSFYVTKNGKMVYQSKLGDFYTYSSEDGFNQIEPQAFTTFESFANAAGWQVLSSKDGSPVTIEGGFALFEKDGLGAVLGPEGLVIVGSATDALEKYEVSDQSSLTELFSTIDASITAEALLEIGNSARNEDVIIAGQAVSLVERVAPTLVDNGNEIYDLETNTSYSVSSVDGQREVTESGKAVFVSETGGRFVLNENGAFIATREAFMTVEAFMQDRGLEQVQIDSQGYLADLGDGIRNIQENAPELLQLKILDLKEDALSALEDAIPESKDDSQTARKVHLFFEKLIEGFTKDISEQRLRVKNEMVDVTGSVAAKDVTTGLQVVTDGDAYYTIGSNGLSLLGNNEHELVYRGILSYEDKDGELSAFGYPPYKMLRDSDFTVAEKVALISDKLFIDGVIETLYGYVETFKTIADNLESDTPNSPSDFDTAVADIHNKLGEQLNDVLDSFKSFDLPLADIDHIKGENYAKFSELSPQFILAVTSAEHATFFRDSEGNSTYAVMRILQYLREEEVTIGGSTIYQQAAKVAGLTFEERGEYSKMRKMGDFFRASNLADAFSREEIFELYVNIINYGGSTEGIKAASLRYFDKNPAELDLAESVILAVGPQRPAEHNANNFANAHSLLARAELLLDNMLGSEMISQTDHEQAVEKMQTLLFASADEKDATSLFAILPELDVIKTNELINQYRSLDNTERIYKPTPDVDEGIYLDLHTYLQINGLIDKNQLQILRTKYYGQSLWQEKLDNSPPIYDPTNDSVRFSMNKSAPAGESEPVLEQSDQGIQIRQKPGYLLTQNNIGPVFAHAVTGPDGSVEIPAINIFDEMVENENGEITRFSPIAVRDRNGNSIFLNSSTGETFVLTDQGMRKTDYTRINWIGGEGLDVAIASTRGMNAINADGIDLANMVKDNAGNYYTVTDKEVGAIAFAGRVLELPSGEELFVGLPDISGLSLQQELTQPFPYNQSITHVESSALASINNALRLAGEDKSTVNATTLEVPRGNTDPNRGFVEVDTALDSYEDDRNINPRGLNAELQLAGVDTTVVEMSSSSEGAAVFKDIITSSLDDGNHPVVWLGYAEEAITASKIREIEPGSGKYENFVSNEHAVTVIEIFENNGQEYVAYFDPNSMGGNRVDRNISVMSWSDFMNTASPGATSRFKAIIPGKTELPDTYAQYEYDPTSAERQIELVLAGANDTIDWTKSTEITEGVTISAELQLEVTDILKEAINNSPEGGNGIIALGMNPETGEIMFNVGLDEDGEVSSTNRATMEAHTPGSVFKLLVAEFLMVKGVNPTALLPAGSSVNLGGYILDDWTKAAGFNTSSRKDLPTAIEQSSNTYFAGQLYKLLSEGVIKDYELAEYAEKVGFVGAKDIIGLIASDSNVTDAEFVEALAESEKSHTVQAMEAIGQENITATALAMAQHTSAYLNGGKVLEPIIIKGQTPQVISELPLSEEQLAYISDGMYRVVTNDLGTASHMYQGHENTDADLYVTGGKTGTAEIGSVDQYGNPQTNAWYVAVSEGINGEKMVTVILAPQGGAGSDQAGIAKQIQDAYHANPVLYATDTEALYSEKDSALAIGERVAEYALSEESHLALDDRSAVERGEYSPIDSNKAADIIYKRLYENLTPSNNPEISIEKQEIGAEYFPVEFPYDAENPLHNVIVTMGDPNAEYTLLVHTHYDTVEDLFPDGLPVTGASDNGWTNIMLEEILINELTPDQLPENVKLQVVFEAGEELGNKVLQSPEGKDFRVPGSRAALDHLQENGLNPEKTFALNADMLVNVLSPGGKLQLFATEGSDQLVKELATALNEQSVLTTHINSTGPAGRWGSNIFWDSLGIEQSVRLTSDQPAPTGYETGVADALPDEVSSVLEVRTGLIVKALVDFITNTQIAGDQRDQRIDLPDKPLTEIPGFEVPSTAADIINIHSDSEETLLPTTGSPRTDIVFDRIRGMLE